MTETLPDPPYWAAIFGSRRRPGDEGYGAMADRMVELARTQPGFLGMDSVRDPEGFGITVSYWRSEADIARWKKDAEHLEAQRLGKEKWYENFSLRIAKVERAYDWRRP